ncbi:hypothetical protein Pfo_029538 [Paulownia fortunei]|nr:hypothetical protein Pfo_029538 [Paulownia fortunei]
MYMYKLFFYFSCLFIFLFSILELMEFHKLVHLHIRKEMKIILVSEKLKKNKMIFFFTLNNVTFGLVEGRMNLEIADYPGTGANPNHDPPVPSGRV